MMHICEELGRIKDCEGAAQWKSLQSQQKYCNSCKQKIEQEQQHARSEVKTKFVELGV